MTSSRATYISAREQVFAHYGRTCFCCGTWRRLTIDHTKGNGKEQRTELGQPSSREFYRWLIIHNFPPEYRTLCHPCNASKKTGEFCGLHRKLLAA